MNWLGSAVFSTWLFVSGLLPVAVSTDPAVGYVQVPSLKKQAILRDVSRVQDLTLARGVQVTDLNTGKVVFEREAHTARPMASLTKLMTAYVILKRHQLDEEVTVPNEVLRLAGSNSQTIGLRVGETYTLEQLLKALLIYSANDAAVTLANYDAGSEAAFVVRMNQTARDLQLAQTSFANASGLDADGHTSSPADLTTLARAALSSPTVKEIVRQRSSVITARDGRVLRLTTTNQLLSDQLVYGVKTGYTEKAGQCLITLSHDGAGREILTVVLNSPDRFAESSRVIHYLLD